jgi:glutaredoxin
MAFTRINGRPVGALRLFTLSTCGWCRKTKGLLNELGVAYEYVDVDLLDAEAAQTLREEVRQWNPNCSFPTLVVNDTECVVGFQEGKLRALTEVQDA